MESPAAINQRISKIYPDNRPSTLEYALMSKEAYQTNLIPKNPLPDYSDWVVEKTKYDHDSQFFCVLYRNDKTRSLVLAYRGTANLWTLATEDMTGIFKNENSPQKKQAFIFIDEVLELKKGLEKEGNLYHLSFTGHSLGAFLAELSVFKLKKEQDLYTHAVTFDSPGSKKSMEEWQSNISNHKIGLEELDIITYLSYPNIVNSCNEHVGTIYTIQPNLKKDNWQEAFFYLGNKNGTYTLRAHSMDGLYLALKKLANDKKSATYAKDWPWGLEQYNKEFFKHAKYKQDAEVGYYEIEVPKDKQKEFEQQFELSYQSHYALDLNYDAVQQLELNHMHPLLKKLLQDFYQAREKMDDETKKQLKEFCHHSQMNQPVQEHLLGYEIKNNFLIAKDVIQLRKLLSDWLSQPENLNVMIKLINFKSVSKKSHGYKSERTFLKDPQPNQINLENDTLEGVKIDLNLDADTPEEREYKLKIIETFGPIKEKLTFIDSSLAPGSTVKNCKVSGGSFSLFERKSTQIQQDSHLVQQPSKPNNPG